MAAPTGQKIVAAATDENVVTGLAEKHIVLRTAIEMVGPGPAVEAVEAGVAKEVVIAAHPGDRVILRAAMQAIGGDIAGDLVVARATNDILYQGPGVALVEKGVEYVVIRIDRRPEFGLLLAGQQAAFPGVRSICMPSR